MSKKEKLNKFSGGEVEVKPSRKIWKKWWFWVIVVVIIFGSIISDDSDTELQETEKKLTTTNAEETQKDIKTLETKDSEETIDKAESKMKDSESQLVENISEDSEDISMDDFIEDIKATVQGKVGENEKILDVKCENEDLCIYVDFSKADPKPLTLEDLAVTRTVSITDGILELQKYDSLWNTITVDFGEIGYIKNGKENIKYNEIGRYFDENSFKLE